MNESKRTCGVCAMLVRLPPVGGGRWTAFVLAGSKYGSAGLPDRLFAHTGLGLSVFVEFKLGRSSNTSIARPSSSALRPLQQHVCATLAASGNRVAVVTHDRVTVASGDRATLRVGWSGVAQWVGSELIGSELIGSDDPVDQRQVQLLSVAELSDFLLDAR